MLLCRAHFGGVDEPFSSLVTESRVSVPLPSGSSSNSLRARQRLHIERSRILDVQEVLAVALVVDSTRGFGSECSRSSSMGLGDRRCMARGIAQIDQGSASPET